MSAAYLDPDGYQHVDSGFDVRADFDSRGPRWSHLYGPMAPYDESKYRPGSAHIPLDGRDKPDDLEEYVSVPVLGEEWKQSELHDLTRRGQAEIRQDQRVQNWRLFKRDQRGLFGKRWLTRQSIVFCVFIASVVLAVVLYFTIPRAPSFTFDTETPIGVDNATVSFNRTPTNFSFTGEVNLKVDTSSTWLPTHFTNIHAKLYELESYKVIAKGDYGNHVLSRRKDNAINIPLLFSYSAVNSSDTAWSNVYNACGHIWTGTTRPDLKFRIELQSSIIGLVSKPFSETQISNVPCPFELDANSV